VRPEKAVYLVQKAINRCLDYGDFGSLADVKPELTKLLSIAVLAESPYDCDAYYGDCRSINTLMYISDRWRCTGRIKWLLLICSESLKEQVK
jgi:hypothetical protein